MDTLVGLIEGGFRLTWTSDYAWYNPDYWGHHSGGLAWRLASNGGGTKLFAKIQANGNANADVLRLNGEDQRGINIETCCVRRTTWHIFKHNKLDSSMIFGVHSVPRDPGILDLFTTTRPVIIPSTKITTLRIKELLRYCELLPACLHLCTVESNHRYTVPTFDVYPRVLIPTGKTLDEIGFMCNEGVPAWRRPDGNHTSLRKLLMIEVLRLLKLEKLAVVKRFSFFSYSSNDLKLIVRYFNCTN